MQWNAQVRHSPTQSPTLGIYRCLILILWRHNQITNCDVSFTVESWDAFPLARNFRFEFPGTFCVKWKEFSIRFFIGKSKWMLDCHYFPTLCTVLTRKSKLCRVAQMIFGFVSIAATCCCFARRNYQIQRKNIFECTVMMEPSLQREWQKGKFCALTPKISSGSARTTCISTSWSEKSWLNRKRPRLNKQSFKNAFFAPLDINRNFWEHSGEIMQLLLPSGHLSKSPIFAQHF